MQEAGKTKDLITTLLQYTLLTNESSWRTKTDLTVLLKEALQTFEDVTDKKIKLYADPLPELELVPWRIKKAFSNLIDNSIRFARPGIDPEIRVTAKKISSGLKIHSNLKDAPYWEISFADNGIGFDNKYKELVFDVFQKIENTPNCGPGVGLAIVRKILNNHEGEIIADSKPGEGTCFRMYFPL
jgi:two-component system CheB/CheR fusion protein